MDISKMFDPNEKPLENLVTDGGFTGIFRNIACIGDSLASGEFETVTDEGQAAYNDMFDYSWGQFLARMSGNTVYNLSRGGMTAGSFRNGFGDSVDYRGICGKCEATIIALGCNDIHNVDNDPAKLGTLADIDKDHFWCNKQTFAGSYASIIQAIREKNPYMHFFFVTLPDDCLQNKILVERQREILYELAEHFPRCYVIDLFQYAPKYDEEFHKHFYMSGHMNPAGYLFTAKIMASYIDYIVRHNMDKFNQLAFSHCFTNNPNYFK